eukprot:6166254-Pyramimonas_sp.AAC.1
MVGVQGRRGGRIMTVKQQAVLGRPGEEVSGKMGQDKTEWLEGTWAVKLVEDLIASTRSAPEQTSIPPLTIPSTGGPGVTYTFQYSSAHRWG